MKRVAVFTSCDSFEAFYGGTFGLTREQFLSTYRNDFVWEYSGGLSARGHEVFIYILSFGEAEVRTISKGLQVRFIPLPRWLRIFDVLLFRLRRFPFGTALRERVAYRAYRKALKNALSDDRIELLYHQEVWTPRFDEVVASTSIPVVAADHGAVYSDWMEAAKRRSLPLAAAVICQSIEGVERARKFGAQAVLMYNGIDVDFFAPPSTSARPKTLLAVGRFVESQKRFADLLTALQSLPDFTLTLVGSGPDESKLKNLAQALGVSDRVTFTGFLSDRSALRILYQECGVFVSTSKWEAVALVVLEAMSCGAAVVATEIPSFRELLTDGVDGILVPVASRHVLVQAIYEAYERRTDLGEMARKVVLAKYSSAVLYDRLSDLIEGVR